MPGIACSSHVHGWFKDDGWRRQKAEHFLFEMQAFEQIVRLQLGLLTTSREQDFMHPSEKTFFSIIDLSEDPSLRERPSKKIVHKGRELAGAQFGFRMAL